MNPLSALNSIGGVANQAGLFDPALRVLGQSANIILPNIPPSPELLVQALRAGKISQAEAHEACLMQGVYPPGAVPMRPGPQAQLAPNRITEFNLKLWDGVWDSSVRVPAPGELLACLNRGYLELDKWEEGMVLQGFWKKEWRDLLIQLAQNEIPTPSSLVTFALREAWSPAVVQRFDYDAEFPQEFAYWMRAQGAAGDARMIRDGRPIGEEVSWDRLFWRVHWANISPTQAYEMYQRLRPNRLARFGADFANMRAFTFRDLQEVLKVNDYPVPFRAQLSALGYRKPRLVDIDRFYMTDQIDAAEVQELHLDLGYSPADARMRTNWLTQKKRDRLNPPVRINPVPAILEQYRLGLLTREVAERQLIRGLSGGRIDPRPPAVDAVAQELDRLLGDNVQAERPALELRREEAELAELRRKAQLLLTNEDAKLAAKSAKEILTAIRRQFLRGYTSEGEAQTTLRSAGIHDDRARAYLESWKRILQSGRLLFSTGKIRSLVVDQILPIQTAERYLENLGWRKPELGYLLAELKRDWELEQEKIAEKAARREQSRAAAQERQAQLLERERAKVVKRLNRQATTAQLRRYYVRGILSASEWVAELEKRGYEKKWIERERSSAEIDRDNYLARRKTRGYGQDRLDFEREQAERARLAAQNQAATPPPPPPAPE